MWHAKKNYLDTLVRTATDGIRGADRGRGGRSLQTWVGSISIATSISKHTPFGHFIEHCNGTEQQGLRRQQLGTME